MACFAAPPSFFPAPPAWLAKLPALAPAPPKFALISAVAFCDEPPPPPNNVRRAPIAIITTLTKPAIYGTTAFTALEIALKNPAIFA